MENPTWQYIGSPITKEMREFIMKSVSDKLDTIKLDDAEESIVIRIKFTPTNTEPKIVDTNHHRIFPRSRRTCTRKRLRRIPP